MTRAEERARVEAVFEAWRSRRPNPELVRLTLDREKTIRNRLRLGYTPEDLILVIRYIHEADNDDPRWMRGEHRRNRTKYLDMENLFRVKRIGERVEAARLWESGQSKRKASEEESSNPFTFVKRAP